jgi:acyl-coenzyme A synthetase/AMP-(fatty) acid ligase
MWLRLTSTLVKLDTVQEAVVKTIEDELSGKRLVAFLVPSISQLLVVSQLRKHLVELFPDHMIPTRYVKLDSMPLTESGKIDRNALSELL